MPVSTSAVKEQDRWVALTDIIGDEDHFGDMDFKSAGTPQGITGIQLDLKIDGISEEIIRATLKQAREAHGNSSQDVDCHSTTTFGNQSLCTSIAQDQD
ncbi:MAG: hypothetical protein U0930_22880 [Pirellulales bacterium]